jgi:hypothetical protein
MITQLQHLQKAHAAANRVALFCKQLCLREAAGHPTTISALRRITELKTQFEDALADITREKHEDAEPLHPTDVTSQRPNLSRATWQPPHEKR